MFYLNTIDNFSYWQWIDSKLLKGLDLIISLLAHFISIAMATFSCLSSNAHFNQIFPPHFSMSQNCVVKFTTKSDESDNASYNLMGNLPPPTHITILIETCNYWTNITFDKNMQSDFSTSLIFIFLLLFPSLEVSY